LGPRLSFALRLRRWFWDGRNRYPEPQLNAPRGSHVVPGATLIRAVSLGFPLRRPTVQESSEDHQTDIAEAARVRLDENLPASCGGPARHPRGSRHSDVPPVGRKAQRQTFAAGPAHLDKLFQEYLGHLPEGPMESNSLYTAKIHMAHFERVVGKGFSVRCLSLDDLQA